MFLEFIEIIEEIILYYYKELLMRFKKTTLILFITLLFPEIYDGYTIYTPGGGFGGNSSTTYLKDADWTTVKTWNHDCGAASMPYLVLTDEPGIENSLLYYPCRVSNTVMDSGGVGGQVKIYNWDGEELWSMVIAGTVDGANTNNELQHHHDIEPLPNGNFLVVAWERLYSSEWQFLGVNGVDNNLNQMWSTAILEIEPNFSTGGYEIVWEWYIKDHLIQDYSSSYSNYGVVSEHPELMDANCGSIGNGGSDQNGDWMHINAIDYNEELDQIIISSRFQDEVYIIDHSTTTEEAATHSGGNSGKGGDFLYRWGKPQNYDRGTTSDHFLGDQHSINWIPQNSPGQGNLICYVNQYESGSSPSAVLEFTPPVLDDGTYYIEDGEPYGPSNYEWISEATSQFNFSTSMQGGAFRLPNGNTLITDCDSATIYQINANGDIEFNYTQSGNNVMIPRAQSYSYEYFDFTQGNPGDVNGDEIINVLDIVQTVNMVLGLQEANSLADLNNDNIVNILDVVQLINLVLNP